MAPVIQKYKGSVAWVFCVKRCVARRLKGGEKVAEMLKRFCRHCGGALDVVTLSAAAELRT